MVHPRARGIGAGALGVLLLAGCASSPEAGNAGAASSAATSGSVTASAPSSPPSASARPPAPSLSSSPGDVTLQGTVSGDGLTCVGFVANDGTRYALSGPGLPGRLVAIAHSFGSSSSGGTQTASVVVVGHPVKGAMSTCSATVFSVTSARIDSMTTK